jgi:hypothetical protein
MKKIRIPGSLSNILIQMVIRKILILFIELQLVVMKEL